MRKPKLPPDTRLDWRDPNMPVLRDYVFADGKKKETVDPDYERRYREHLLRESANPKWQDDPTYQTRKAKP